MEEKNSTYFGQAEFILSIKNGDSDSFKKLFLFYYDRLCRFAYRYVKSRNLAEDLVQEVFVKIWERREQLDIDGNLQSYLYKILKNEALDLIEHQGMVSKKLTLLKLNMHDDVLNQKYETSDNKQFILQIQNLIEQLPDRTQQIYKLNKIDGLSYEEIADVLDISIKTVEYHISKVFEYIRNSVKYDLRSSFK